MKYPFLTLPDETEIVHSEMHSDGTVEVYVEKPDERDGFHNASCILPSYSWVNVHGFSLKELLNYEAIISSTSHLIMEFSQTGGFDNAANI